MNTQPYVNFNGRCEEALNFYREAVNAEVLSLMRMKEMPEPAMVTPGQEEKVLHASFRVGNDTLMASDGRCLAHAEFSGISLALTLDTPKEAQTRFAALSAGGEVEMPLTPTFFSPSFGMLKDRFGVHWMILAKA